MAVWTWNIACAEELYMLERPVMSALWYEKHGEKTGGIVCA